MNQQLYLDAMHAKGVADATDLQKRSATMDGTALYTEGEKIPDFTAACAKMNMLERPVGFVCKSSAGRVVKLLQVYDSAIYTAEPEELPAQWGFKWSTNPDHALPFIALSTSPYNKGECCTFEGKTWRSTADNNVWSPVARANAWVDVATEGQGSIDPQPSPTVPEYKQPTGGHDAYRKGDRVTYKGKVYESTIDANVYAPDAYPQGWREVQA